MPTYIVRFHDSVYRVLDLEIEAPDDATAEAMAETMQAEADRSLDWEVVDGEPAQVLDVIRQEGN